MASRWPRRQAADCNSGAGPSWQAALERDRDYAFQLQLKEALQASASDFELQQLRLREGLQEAYTCGICLELLPASAMLTLTRCNHRFCLGCLRKLALSATQSKKLPVRCAEPGCPHEIDVEDINLFLQMDEEVRLLAVMAEASVTEAERFYCPYRRCSALMIDAEEVPEEPDEDYEYYEDCQDEVEVQCSACQRPICLRCRVPWHDGLTCAEFRSGRGQGAGGTDSEDEQLLGLAREKKWQRCAKCGIVVELKEGCHHITCSCSYEFCYVCAAPYADGKATCECPMWEEDLIFQQNLNLDCNRNRRRRRRGPRPQAQQLQQPQQLQQRANLYKTQMCRYYNTPNGCPRANCWFAHGAHELRHPHPY